MQGRTFAKRVLSLGATCALLVGSTAMSAENASLDDVTSEELGEVIHVDRPAPFPIFEQTGAGGVGVESATAVEYGNSDWILSEYDAAEFEPALGESLTVHYSNATTIYSTVALACTESITVGYPYKSNNNARVQLNVARSSGCSGTKTAYGSLRVKVFLGYDYRNSDQIPVLGGQNWGSNLVAPCANSNTTNWMGAMGWDPADSGADNKKDKNLSCGG